MTDSKAARAYLPWAETVFCEWAMGNAVWFSHRKRPGQRLIVRLHLQEVQARLPFLWQIDWGAVDRLVCICHHTYDWLCAEFPILRGGRAVIVYNPIDAAALARPKLPLSEFNLGFVGMVPQRKRIDIAFDILAALRETDERYRLHVKGRQPGDYSWMRGRREEMAWYRALEERIEGSPHRNAVVFDPQGADMPDWYAAMGFILSTSDFEGSHQAIAEGMAAGCVPLIREWEGADRIYPGRFQFGTVAEAVARVGHWRQAGRYLETAQACRDFARAHFDHVSILEKLKWLLAEGTTGLGRMPKRGPVGPPGIAVLGYLPPGGRNGYRIRIEQEIKQYRRLAANITLIALHPPAMSLELSAHARELAALGCRVCLVEARDFFAMELSEEKALPILQAIERILAEHDVSMLHAEALYCMRLAAMLAPRCANLRLVFDHHGVSPEEEAMGGAHPNRVKALEGFERLALITPDLNLFVSNAMAAHYAAKYELPPYDYRVLPCCVEDRFFVAGSPPEQLKLPSERPMLGYAGSLAVWQCGSEMLALFAQLQRRDPSLFFLLLTPEREQETARLAAAAAGIPGDALCIAEVAHDQIPACLSRLDLGLLLRRSDPVNQVASPTKFAEYLAAGVPVLMTESIGDYSAACQTENLGLVIAEAELLSQPVPEVTLTSIEGFLRQVRADRRGWSIRCRHYARDHLAWERALLPLHDFLGLGPDVKGHVHDPTYKRGL
jgi:glycosyltransferase involved in cell wall biosynthesis